MRCLGELKCTFALCIELTELNAFVRQVQNSRPDLRFGQCVDLLCQMENLSSVMPLQMALKSLS